MANPLESIRRKLLSVASGDRYRDSQSLHRFVLLKNSLTLAQTPQPALAEPEEEEEVEEGVVDEAVEDSFVFPDVSSFQGGASTQDAEREWLDGLLEGLEDDEDDDDASILSSSALFDDELPPSPTASPAALKTTTFYPPPLSPPFQLSMIPYTGPLDPRPSSFSSSQPLADDPDDDLRPPSLQADDGDDESDITDGPITPFSISTSSLPRRVSSSSLRDDTGIFVEQLSSYFSPYDIDDPPSDNSCC